MEKAIQSIKESVIRFDDFFKATEHIRIEFHIWKSETDLTHIELDGIRIPVHRCTFLEYFRWIQIKDAEYEIIETHKLENKVYIS